MFYEFLKESLPDISVLESGEYWIKVFAADTYYINIIDEIVIINMSSVTQRERRFDEVTAKSYDYLSAGTVTSGPHQNRWYLDYTDQDLFDKLIKIIIKPQ